MDHSGSLMTSQAIMRSLFGLASTALAMGMMTLAISAARFVVSVAMGCKLGKVMPLSVKSFQKLSKENKVNLMWMSRVAAMSSAALMSSTTVLPRAWDGQDGRHRSSTQASVDAWDSVRVSISTELAA